MVMTRAFRTLLISSTKDKAPEIPELYLFQVNRSVLRNAIALYFAAIE